jgi:hypothetical protein
MQTLRCGRCDGVAIKEDKTVSKVGVWYGVTAMRATKKVSRCCAALWSGEALTSYCFFGWLDVV